MFQFFIHTVAKIYLGEQEQELYHHKITRDTYTYADIHIHTNLCLFYNKINEYENV